MAPILQSEPSDYICKDSRLLFPWKYFSKLSTQYIWGSWHLCQAQTDDVDFIVQEEMTGKHTCCKSPPAWHRKVLMKSLEYERPYQSRRCPDRAQGQPFKERCCMQITRHVPAPSEPLGPFFHRTASNQETTWDELGTERTFKCRLGLKCCPFYSSPSFHVSFFREGDKSSPRTQSHLVFL